MEKQIVSVAGWRLAILAGLLVLAGAIGGSAQPGGDESVPETFTATTANMDPEGTDLRFNVLRWSVDAEREAVLDVLTDAGAEPSDDGELDALIELPTMGYVWPDGSSLGYAIKYARRDAAADGSGDGAGTMSPAADVAFDEANRTVALTNYDTAPTLLAAAKRQPAPYWAR